MAERLTRNEQVVSSILTIGSNIRPRNRDDYADFSFPVRVLPFTLPFTDYKLFSLSLTVCDASYKLVHVTGAVITHFLRDMPIYIQRECCRIMA